MSPAARGLAPLLFATPVVMSVSPATIGFAVSVYALGWLTWQARRLPWRRLLGTPVALGVCTLGAFGVASAGWAVDPGLATSKALKWLLLCLPCVWFAYAVAARRGTATREVKALVTGTLCAALLLAVQTFGDVLLRSFVVGAPDIPAALKINVPAAALAILAWAMPALAAGNSRLTRLGAWLALAVIGISVLAGDGSAPRLAFAIGGLTYVVAWRLPRVAAVLLLVAVAGAHVAAPRLLSVPGLPALTSDRSLHHRMEVWDLVGGLIAVRPWFGYGFANSESIPALPGRMPLTATPRRIPMYPHNAMLQAQLELGVVGLVAFYAALGWLLRALLRTPRETAAAGLAMLGAGLSVWSVGYPLWRSTWLGWLLFAAIALVSTLGLRTPSTCRAS